VLEADLSHPHRSYSVSAPATEQTSPLNGGVYCRATPPTPPTSAAGVQPDGAIERRSVFPSALSAAPTRHVIRL